MEQRQRVHEPVVGRPAPRLARAPRRRRAGCRARAPRPSAARGAAGVARSSRDRRRPPVETRVGRRRRPAEARRHRAIGGRHAERQRRRAVVGPRPSASASTGRGHVDDVRELRPRVGGVRRDHHGPEAQERDVGEDRVERRSARQQDPVARPHARRRDERGERSRALLDVPRREGTRRRRRRRGRRGRDGSRQCATQEEVRLTASILPHARRRASLPP